MRELENVINRARILAEDNRLRVGDLPSGIITSIATGTYSQPPVFAASTSDAPVGSLRELVRNFEADLLLRTVEQCGGDRRLAAHRLAISLSTLYRKLDEITQD